MPGPAFLSGESIDLRTFEEEDVAVVRPTVNATEGTASAPHRLASGKALYPVTRNTVT